MRGAPGRPGPGNSGPGPPRARPPDVGQIGFQTRPPEPRGGKVGDLKQRRRRVGPENLSRPDLAVHHGSVDWRRNCQVADQDRLQPDDGRAVFCRIASVWISATVSAACARLRLPLGRGQAQTRRSANLFLAERVPARESQLSRAFGVDLRRPQIDRRLIKVGAGGGQFQLGADVIRRFGGLNSAAVPCARSRLC
jgi:hypothetical protein